jgi:type IX secretion system PorP/SprF family membrane protein
MISKNAITRAGLIIALSATMQAAHAQDVHFTQFDAQPLTVNPAFTGNFDGQVRAAAIYRSQWQSVTTGYTTYGASVDMPLVHDLSIDDYLAGGLQLYNDRAGDGNLQNFVGMLSIAYHKGFGVNESRNRASQLSVGFQGGYAEKSIDLSKLYFGDEYNSGAFVPGTSQEYHLGVGNSVHYYVVNAGISFAQRAGDNFSYILGVAANNLNQPSQSFEKKTNSQVVGLSMRYTGELGIMLGINDRFSLRPAVLYQTQSSASEIIAGNEFHLVVGNAEVRQFSTAVFLGGWYRTGDAVMITGGVEFKGFRVGVSYDYNTSSLKTASNGNGGFELSLRYIAPNPLDFAHSRTIPCDRF